MEDIRESSRNHNEVFSAFFERSDMSVPHWNVSLSIKANNILID